MKIIGIVGIFDQEIAGNRFWHGFEEGFKNELGVTDFVVEHVFYLPWQSKKITDFSHDILKKYDKGDEILLVGHSFGGVIACAIAPQFSVSAVRAVVTINSPHKITAFYKYFNSTQKTLSMPVISFGSIFDYLVPFFLTRYPGDHHFTLFANHLFAFLLSKRPARRIARKTREILDAQRMFDALT